MHSIDRFFNLVVLKHFVSIADTLSFTKASQQLGVTKSKLSKDISRLEKETNAKLFDRTSRVVALTEAGHILYARALSLLEESNSLFNDLDVLTNSVSGNIKVAAPPAFGRLLSQAFLPQFMQQWSDISISLKLSYAYENLFKEGLDIAFRFGKNMDVALIEKQIGQSNRVIVAAPSYLQKNGCPKHFSQLSSHTTLSFQNGSTMDWSAYHGETVDEIRLTPKFICEDFVTLVNTVSIGSGIAQLPWFIVKDHIASGELVQILASCVTKPLPIFIVYREGLSKPNKMKAFLEWINTHQDKFNFVKLAD